MWAGLGLMHPWMLAGLVVVPVIWHLLRILPPNPRLIDFAPIHLVRHLTHPRQTSARMPLWLMLLRLALVVLLVLALAGPILNPVTVDARKGPIMLVLDDGWASAPDWAARRQLAESWINQAERQQRLVLLTGTAAGRHDLGLYPAHEARRKLAAWQPLPMVPDRAKLADLLAEARNQDQEAGLADASILWLDDGLDSPGSDRLADQLNALGPVMLYGGGGQMVLHAPRMTRDGFEVPISRLAVDTAAGAHAVPVRALAADGRLLGQQDAVFAPGQHKAEARLALPPLWRNEVARLVIPGHASVAASWLVDDALKRRAVVVATAQTSRQNQPLLTPSFYLEQALRDGQDVTTEPLDAVLARLAPAGGAVHKPAMIVLADAQNPTPAQQEQLLAWVSAGGVLVRFAGPQMTAESGVQDQLLPSRLRPHERQMGGAMTWEKPLPLAGFPAHSPFAGMDIPDDVTIKRQILAEPDIDLPGKSWAMLRDGTPLVTAAPKGNGYLVLFHVTATPDWSNLPISGVFVGMLQRLANMGGVQAPSSDAGDSNLLLQPVRVLDGYGVLQTPGPDVRPIEGRALADWIPNVMHPPGLYGRGGMVRPLNFAMFYDRSGGGWPAPLVPPPGATLTGAAQQVERSLMPVLLGLCLVLFLLDWLVSLWVRGYHPRALARIGIGVVMLMVWVPVVGRATERTPTAPLPEQAEILADRPWLGYMRTGDDAVDAQSQRGLEQLAALLRARTAADIPGAKPVDPGTDPLALFPLIYWPMTETQPPLTPEAAQRINQWLARGGMMIFDTRDQDAQAPGGIGPGVARLRVLTRDLDMPPLQPVPAGHVLGKAFYLLDEFPGRMRGGTFWIEATDQRRHDGVARVIVTSHDLAAAWAKGTAGISDPGLRRQYELAMRTGINLVMYVLTGNYKADQVHVPFILERLGE